MKGIRKVRVFQTFIMFTEYGDTLYYNINNNEHKFILCLYQYVIKNVRICLHFCPAVLLFLL